MPSFILTLEMKATQPNELVLNVSDSEPSRGAATAVVGQQPPLLTGRSHFALSEYARLGVGAGQSFA